MKAFKKSILNIALLLIVSVSAQAASAKVTEVTGTVFKYNNGSNQQLKVGDILKEGDSISATAMSEAMLVFSNGSELTIKENTSINIDKLQQDSFAGNKSYEQLQADPSKSQTLLSLNYGELSGHVKKLQQGSNFNVETPLGTAAIRGTKWSALLIYNAERGEFILSVKNYDGLVDIISKYAGGLEFGDTNIADKGYNPTLSDATRELIPADHTVFIRLPQGSPYFDGLYKLIQNQAPTTTNVPRRVITPGDTDFGIGDDDFGIIVVSPEGPAN